jgi:hypothetical protein
MQSAKILIGLTLLTSFSAAANVSKWVMAEEKGARQYVVESKDGSTLNFTCDIGYKTGSPDAAGDRILFLEGPNDEFDSDEKAITLSVGNEKYTISSTGSSVADSNWYAFWSDTPDATNQTVDAYVEGEKIASFTMHNAAELYKSSPEDGCLKRSK